MDETVRLNEPVTDQITANCTVVATVGSDAARAADPADDARLTHARIAVAEYARAHGVRDPLALARLAVECVDAIANQPGVGSDDLVEPAIERALAALPRHRQPQQTGTPAPRPSTLPAPRIGRMPAQPLGELANPVVALQPTRLAESATNVVAFLVAKVVGIGS